MLPRYDCCLRLGGKMTIIEFEDKRNIPFQGKYGTLLLFLLIKFCVVDFKVEDSLLKDLDEALQQKIIYIQKINQIRKTQPDFNTPIKQFELMRVADAKAAFPTLFDLAASEFIAKQGQISMMKKAYL